MAVRSIVDLAARVRRTSTSSVYCTPGVPRRSSNPTGTDSTRYAVLPVAPSGTGGTLLYWQKLTGAGGASNPRLAHHARASFVHDVVFRMYWPSINCTGDPARRRKSSSSCVPARPMASAPRGSHSEGYRP